MIQELRRGRAKGEGDRCVCTCRYGTGAQEDVLRPMEAAGAGYRGSRDGIDGRHVPPVGRHWFPNLGQGCFKGAVVRDGKNSEFQT